MRSAKKVGVLSLQGNFEQHSRLLGSLGIRPLLVRLPADLEAVEGLVLPGGESTTQMQLLQRNGLRQPIQAFAERFPVLGTCAGLILMANSVEPTPGQTALDPLGLIDVRVQRNAFGRQIHSKIDRIELVGGGGGLDVAFIRAPAITLVGPKVEVIATHGRAGPCAVRHNNAIGLTFHPEMGDVTYFHEMAFSKN